MNRKMLISSIAVLAIAFVIAGCGKKTKTPPPPPISATLTASPDTITAGQSSTLTWTTQSAASASIDQGVGSVDVNGNKTVSPTSTTTYTLTATDSAGKTSTATATVTVNAAPTATPEATPQPTVEATPDVSALFNQAAQDIYFDYDKSDVRPSEQGKVSTLAQFLNANSSVHIQIEGNADERGSTEYNLALGDKRANSVKDALVSAGVSADRLKTISYGKEKPVCTESNEECWQKNRRVHFTQLQ